MHVAIIMDGNGRWARTRGWPRWRGHVAGADAVRRVLRAAPDMGITVLTLYAFSSDNWRRPPDEIARIFRLLREYCRREQAQLVANGVRVTAVGRRDRIPTPALRALEATEAATRHGTRIHLRLAIDYSAHHSITEAVRTLVAQVGLGTIQPVDISPDALDHAISIGVPPPDLLIRTAGEHRLSDFMLWEIAYTELFFTDVLWPDFGEAGLQEALTDYLRRERRFGGLTAVSPRRATAGS